MLSTWRLTPEPKELHPPSQWVFPGNGKLENLAVKERFFCEPISWRRCHGDSESSHGATVHCCTNEVLNWTQHSRVSGFKQYDQKMKKNWTPHLSAAAEPKRRDAVALSTPRRYDGSQRHLTRRITILLWLLGCYLFPLLPFHALQQLSIDNNDSFKKKKTLQ